MPFSVAITKLLSAVDSVNAASFATNLSALQLLLKDPKNSIRFFIYSSSGMGHQSTAANIIYRLISLGLTGSYQVIYINAFDALKKIAALFPQFDPKNPDTPIVIGAVTLTFIELDDFQKSSPTLLNIGIAGGTDGIMHENFAAELYVNYLLVLQPYQWYQEPSVIQKNDGTRINLDKNKVLASLSFSKRGYFIDIPKMTAQEIAFFQASAYADKYPAFDAITNSLLSQKSNMMPVYGLTMFDSPATRTSDVMLFNLATAIAYAQDNTARVGNAVKGTIVIVLSELSDETYASFDALLAGTDPRLDDNPLKDWVTARKLSTRVKHIKYDDPLLPSAIGQVESKATRIMFVDMGGVPLYAFNYLYNVSDMPPVFEGAATNSLVLNFGKNYFAIRSGINRDFILYPTLPLNAATPSSEAETVDAASRLVESTIMEWGRDLNNEAVLGTPASILGLDILIAFEPPDASGQQYFTSLGAFFHNEQEDKMLMGVFSMLQYLKNK